MFLGLFRNPSDKIYHHIHIVRTSCDQLPARSRIFFLLLGLVYWPCGLRSVFPTINSSLLEIIVKVKLAVKFCLHSFEFIFKKIKTFRLTKGTQFWMILSPKKWRKIFFLSCLRHCNRRLIVVIRLSNLKQKKNSRLLLVELLAVTWVPCILIHPILVLCETQTASSRIWTRVNRVHLLRL